MGSDEFQERVDWKLWAEKLGLVDGGGGAAER